MLLHRAFSPSIPGCGRAMMGRTRPAAAARFSTGASKWRPPRWPSEQSPKGPALWASRRPERAPLRRVSARRWSSLGILTNGGGGTPPASLVAWRTWLRQRFAASIESHSFAGQALMAGVFYCIGDMSAQTIEYVNRYKASGGEHATAWAYDWRRTVRMGTFGILIAGPMLAGWYRTLHAVTKIYRYSYEPLVGLPAVLHRMRVPGACQESGIYQGKCLVQENGAKQLWYNVAAKTFADNFLFNPFFLTCYFVGLGALEGRSYDAIMHKTKSDFHNAWLVGLALWIPVQVINFRWVPVAHQASFVTFIATAWKTFLSIMFHREEAEEEETTAATTTEELRHPSSNSSSGSTGGKPGIMSDDMEGHGADAAAVHRLVQEQQAEIDRLRLQTAEMHQLRAELEQLRSHVQRKPPSMQLGAVGGGGGGGGGLQQ